MLFDNTSSKVYIKQTMVNLEKVDAARTYDSDALAQRVLALRSGESSSVAELRQRFFDSMYGKFMRSQQPLRYSQRYGYDPKQMESDLGDDVCPVLHQYNLLQYVQLLIDAEINDDTLFSSLTGEDITILSLACSIHDIGECTHPRLETYGLTLVGDIAYGNKTDEDRENEAKIRKFFYNRFFGDIDPTIIERVEAIISHNDLSILHTYYEAAHRLQELQTVNNAHDAHFELTHTVLPGNTSAGRIGKLNEMIRDVTSTVEHGVRTSMPFPIGQIALAQSLAAHRGPRHNPDKNPAAHKQCAPPYFSVLGTIV